MAGIMDGLRSLFAGGTPKEDAPASEPVTHKDFLIFCEPISEGGQWRLAGRIVHGEGEGRREHDFIRADVFANRNDAEAATLVKARRLIDEQGMDLFGTR